MILDLAILHHNFVLYFSSQVFSNFTILDTHVNALVSVSPASSNEKYSRKLRLWWSFLKKQFLPRCATWFLGLTTDSMTYLTERAYWLLFSEVSSEISALRVFWWRSSCTYVLLAVVREAGIHRKIHSELFMYQLGKSHFPKKSVRAFWALHEPSVRPHPQGA